MMAQVEGSTLIICDGCGVEVRWAPVRKDEKLYCCDQCARGLPCRCSAIDDIDDTDPRLRWLDAKPD